MASRSLTIDLDDATMAIVDRVARLRGISSVQFVADAVRRAAERDEDDDVFVQAGIDDIERGNVVPHGEVMAELDAMIAKHRSRCG